MIWAARAAFLLASAGSAAASPPEPCLNAPSFAAALEALEGTEWTRVTLAEALDDRTASLIWWTLVDPDRDLDMDRLGRLMIHEQPSDRTEQVQHLLGARAAIPDQQTATFLRDDDVMSITQRFLVEEGTPVTELEEVPAFFWCDVLLWGASTSATSGRFGAPESRRHPEGWLTTMAVERALLAMIVDGARSDATVYRNRRHLWIQTDTPP